MKIKKILIAIVFILASTNLFSQDINNIDIPFQKYVLKNGLTLIVHEDHKAPIVAVNVWYHVGSKNEKFGKTGFAHLFEHLMFNGSENYNDDYFKAMERVGATDLNGTTNNDRTNYFQNVPTSAFDIALWMESDRMGHLLGAIDQGKLDEQRGVVQNEKRLGENEPYSLSRELITKGTYPKEHPYSWTVIGSMDDLNAASLDDVKEWFKTYYGPNNAVLVIAGDVNPKEAKEKVEKYFGNIPPGPPIVKHQTWVAKMTGTKRQIAEDRVPQSRIYKVWNVPEWGSKDLVYLDLVSDVLASGKNSRLYKRLVYDDQIATDVYAYYDGKEIGSQFVIRATAKPGGDLTKVESAINEELSKFLEEGPSEKELKRVKVQYFSNFIRGIERIGGFGGKSDILSQSQVYGGSPDFYKTKLKIIKNAKANDLKYAAINWLSDGEYILEIHPYPNYKALASNVDRSKLPETKTPPDAKFPAIQRSELSNGLKIILAQRATIPIVNFNMMIDAGYAADQFATPGTASMVMNMLDEGTKTRNSLEINEELQMLGSKMGTGSDPDHLYISLSSLKSNLDKSLDLYSDIILNPSFSENELSRLKNERIAQIKREKASPIQMGLRVFPVNLYGKNHAYGIPLSGSGYEETVEKFTRNDMVKFHNTWFKPNNATLIVVGDISMEELKPKLEKLFSSWQQGNVPKKNISIVQQRTKPIIYLLDRPGSQQSIIFAGNVVPPKEEDEIAVVSMNNMLGGSFTSRINMNLRENKHWSYGSGSFIFGTVSQRPYLFYGLVQMDKTKEAMQEMYNEVKGLLNEKPATSDELTKVKLNQTQSLAGSWETNNSVGNSLVEMVKFNLPQDYFEKYSSKVKNLNLDDIQNAAAKVLHPDNLIWIVVTDASKEESNIKEIGYELRHIDGDGVIID